MKLIRNTGLIALLVTVVTMVGPTALAATSPSLGAASSFVILSDTYTNSVSGTTLNGDLGYTTPPATTPTVNGTTHMADSTYNQAGIDQGKTLSLLNSQPCTFTFAPGPIDLASDTTHGPVGVYTPGVYCAAGAIDIGGGGTVTLNGAGAYIFRMDGALTSSANSVVTLSGGASACDVWWTPTQATTLGADSSFVGTDIDASGITIGNAVTWQGQALAFGGIVTTAADTITNPTCSASRSATPVVATIPGLPNTGLGNTENNSAPLTIVGATVAVLLVAVGYGVRKKLFSA